MVRRRSSEAVLNNILAISTRSAVVLVSHYFAGSLGILAGFTTMIGNLAGAVINIYFLALRLPKNIFIGTTAYVFFLINVFKVPFHVWVWETIQWESLQISLYLIPVELLGLLFGVRWVKYIPDTNYRRLILILTGLGSLALFFK